ncbi:MAG: hypothetical protein GXO91_08745 [FCB group bacterium]|nr:hypothetical protein [FCB group bacterium]
MKFIRLRFLLLSTAVLLAGLWADPIALRIPNNLTAVAGDIIDIPVYADSSFTGEDVLSYQLQINYNGSILQFQEVINTGTISETFGPTTVNDSNSGTLIMAGAGVEPLSGSGTLLIIRFLGLQAGGSYLQFYPSGGNYFNEGSPGITLLDGYIQLYAQPILYISPSSGTLIIGETLQFSASNGTPPYAWSVSDETVGSIDASGLFTAEGQGSCQVQAMDSAGITGISGQIIVQSFDLTLPDSSALQGEIIDIPIYTSDLTPAAITSGSLTLSFNPNFVTPTSIVTTGTLLEGYSDPVFNYPGENYLYVSFATISPLSGSGILFYIQLAASPANWGGTNINFESALFNEDILARTHNAYFTVIQLPPITVYPATSVLIAGDTLRFSASGGIEPYAWSTTDMAAATIDEQGLLTAHHSGVIQVMATDDVGGVGISGNIQIYDTWLSLPEEYVTIGADYDFPVNIGDLPEDQTLNSVQMAIDFMSPDLEFIEVITAGSLTEGWSYAADVSGNRVTLAGAGASSVEASGVLVYLRFHVTTDVYVGEWAWINFFSVLLNEGIPLPLTDNGYIIGSDVIYGCTDPGAYNYNPDATADDGSCYGMLGDLNQDGAMDILDIVRLVGIIIGSVPNPTDYELWAGDLNGDGAQDILDIVTLVGIIING